ncbi:MAG TPA: hypothetical protein VIJ16_11095, partial [Gemmatimonadaceae bacterium]
MIVAVPAIALALLVGAHALAAQENYEIEVYPSATVAPKSLALELHSNFTFQGQRLYVDGVAPTRHADHETVEATLGVTNWSEVGAYLFTNEQNGLGAKWVGNSARARVRVPDSWAWPLGLSLSSEIEYARPLFSEDAWTWEIRPIADKYEGRWYLSVNPTLERVLQGANARRGFQFTPSVKASYDVTEKVTAGLEYYAAPGERQGLVIPLDVDTVVAPVLPGGPSLARAVDNDAVLHLPHGER